MRRITPIGNNAGASAGVVRDVGGARAPSRLRLRLFFWIGNFFDFKYGCTHRPRNRSSVGDLTV